MPGERPSHIPPENPFGSSEGKHPPEPTEKFVERYLGKRRGAGGAAGSSEQAAPEPTDLVTPDERTAREEERRAEHADFAELYTAETAKLRELFGRKIEVPLLPPDVTAEHVHEWRELGFALHYLPRVEIVGTAPGLKTPLRFNRIDKSKIDRFGPDRLKPTELPGVWVLVDARPKPRATDDATKKYPNDAEIEAALGGSRFNRSWSELHEPTTLAKLADILNVDPSQVRLPRAIEFNVLGNLYHPKWGSTNTYEWFEDSYNSGQARLIGGSSGDGGLANVSDSTPRNWHHNFGFRPLVILS